MKDDIVLETPIIEEDQPIIEDVTFKNLGGVGYTSPSAQVQSGPISFGTQVNI